MIFEALLLADAYQNIGQELTVYTQIELGGKLCRILFIATSFFVLWKGPYMPKEKQELQNDEPTETQGLLSGAATENGTADYGAIPVTVGTTETTEARDPDEQDYEREEREAKLRMEKRLAKDGNWWTYAKSFAVI